MKIKAIYLINYVNYFYLKILQIIQVIYLCQKKNITRYTLKGYYGDYFVKLLVYFKKNNFKIIEIPFKDELRASGFSKTVVNLNLKYLYTCLRYFLTLIICFFAKFKN